ncbi:MAG: AI-2E family transporter [Candidatus Gottesmanbacteria bacterium]|nr:AI-2E family transporter [Candidatus Gottesmanbacteria bacterium]
MTSKIEISHKTIIFTVIFLLALWVLFQIKDILFLIFIAFILMTALRPLVDWLAWVRIPRVLTILLIYGIVFGFFGVSFAGTIPTLVIQSTKFVQELPTFLEKVLPYWNIDARSLSQQIAPISENIVKLTVGIFSNLLTTLTVLVFTFYFLLERRKVEDMLVNTMGEEAADRIIRTLKEVESRLGAWVNGQLFLMILIGVLVYLGLTLLHVEFALPLAIIAGVLEIVPMIGPIVSAVPAVLVALTISPFLALSVVALYFIVQQVENNIFVPLVLKKSVGLSPIVTIFALMVGARLAGVVGAVLAVPVVLVLQSLLRAFLFPTQKK